MTDPDAGRRGTASFLTPAAAANAPAWQPAPHAVYQAVLRGFASTGRPPEPAELQETARRHGITASQALAGWSRDHGPGRKPALSDTELACVAVAHLLGIASERRWIRYARKNLARMFPRLPGQSGYGKRLRRCGGLLAAVITELA